MNFFIGNAYAQGNNPAPIGAGFEWIFLIAFFAIFYFLIWRPQAKRNKETKNLLGSLQKGDEIVTSGGIAGVIRKVSDDFIILEASSTVELKIQKGAVVAALPKGTLKDIEKSTETKKLEKTEIKNSND